MVGGAVKLSIPRAGAPKGKVPNPKGPDALAFSQKMDKRVRKILSKYGMVIKTTPFPADFKEEHKIFAQSKDASTAKFESSLFMIDIFVFVNAYQNRVIDSNAVSRAILRLLVTNGCCETRRKSYLCEIFSWEGVKMLDDYLEIMVIFQRIGLMNMLLDNSQLEQCLSMAKAKKMDHVMKKISTLIEQKEGCRSIWFSVEKLLSPQNPTTLFDVVPLTDDGTVTIIPFPKDVVRCIDLYLAHPDDVYTIKLQVCGTLLRLILGANIVNYNIPLVKENVLAHFVKTFGTSLKATDIVAHTSTKNLWGMVCSYIGELETILGVEYTSNCDRTDLVNGFFEQHFTPKEYQNLIQRYIDDEDDEEDIDEDE
jgi:hypothetical protein